MLRSRTVIKILLILRNRKLMNLFGIIRQITLEEKIHKVMKKKKKKQKINWMKAQHQTISHTKKTTTSSSNSTAFSKKKETTAHPNSVRNQSSNHSSTAQSVTNSTRKPTTS